jgi:hypothetical protein
VGTSDYVPFYVTARHFIETGEITSSAGVRNYLPFFTLLMVPLAGVPCWLGAALMAAMSIAGLVLSVTMMLRALVPDHPAPLVVRATVPVLMVLPFLHACLVLGQVSILIGLLCLLTWWLVALQRPWPAGLPLAIALLVKPFLVTLLIFLVLKRQWRAVVSTIGWTAVFGVGLTLATMRPATWLEAHRDYYQRVLCRQTPLALIGAEKPRYARFSNQSLAMVLRRLTTETQAGHSRKPFQVNLVQWSPRTTQAIYLVILAAIAVVTVGVGRFSLRRIEPERAHFEFAMFLLWGLCASPIVWTHYYPLVLYPLVLLTVTLVRDGDVGRSNRLGQVAWWIWIAAAASLVTEAVGLPVLRAIGVHVWAMIVVWAAMATCAHRVHPVRSG